MCKEGTKSRNASHIYFKETSLDETTPFIKVYTELDKNLLPQFFVILGNSQLTINILTYNILIFTKARMNWSNILLKYKSPTIPAIANTTTAHVRRATATLIVVVIISTEELTKSLSIFFCYLLLDFFLWGETQAKSDYNKINIFQTKTKLNIFIDCIEWLNFNTCSLAFVYNRGWVQIVFSRHFAMPQKLFCGLHFIQQPVSLDLHCCVSYKPINCFAEQLLVSFYM